MATQERIRAALEITRIAMQVSIQGKYHVFANYSGHIDSLNIYAYEAKGDYSGPANKEPMKGWSCIDKGRTIYLDTCSDEAINAMADDVLSLLDVDQDGIPL